MSDYATQAADAIRQSVQPLATVLEGINADIARLEKELTRARESRTVALKMLRLADPEAAERFATKPGPKKKKEWNRRKISGGALDTLRIWLQENPDAFPNGFMAKDLFAIRDRIGVVRSMPAFSAYLLSLQEEGMVRLDHYSDLGGKIYKVTTNE